MLRNLTAWHLVIVAAVLILLFGANKLPELAKGVGQSLKIFKNEVKDLTDDRPTVIEHGASAPAAPVAGTAGAAAAPAAAERPAARG